MDIDSVDLSVLGTSTKGRGLKSFCANHGRVLIFLLIILLCFGIGIILGHFTASSSLVTSGTNGIHYNRTSEPDGGGEDGNVPVTPASTSSQAYIALINGLIEKFTLQGYLKYFTSGAHHAGSPGNLENANHIYEKWTGYGFDVRRKKYRVLLSRPNPLNPNKVVVVDTRDNSIIKGFTLDDGVSSPMLQPFAVYGSNASITDDPVYVNYATTEDFNNLRDLTQIPHANNICLARLGKIPLAQMAQISRDRGCLGLLAFPDPNPYAREGTLPSNCYPHSWWLPYNGVPREMARLSMGDPTTPFFPSHDWMPRQPTSSLLDGFPVQTISYDTAKGLLRDMANPPASDSKWIGGLPIYNIGPGFHATGDGNNQYHKLKIEVNNKLQFADITNVIATIQGTIEPDRYVIIGNHRDSLAYGVVSPGTGTACLMEVARVLSELMKRGWRPRRTIILASWDAGEDGLVGSTEWVEENMERLRSRGVAYINLDDAVSGNYSFSAAGSPLLTKVVFQATKDVNCPDPSHSSMSIHHNWASRRPISPTNAQPQLDPLGMSSDSAPFLMLAGVPSVDLQYTYDEEYYAVPRYPTFHTAFDQGKNINLFIDPEFTIHAAVTEVATKALITLSDTPKLTMDLTHYADSLTRYVQQFKEQYGDLLTQQNISLDQLELAVRNFSTVAQSFQQRFDSIDETNELMLREMNDHILSVERAFLINEGFTLNPESRHLIYSASTTSAYKGAAFGPLAQMIVTEKEQGNWIYVDQTVGYTTLGLQAATGILTDADLH